MTARSIAIIGFSFRFPGDISDSEHFWRVLKKKKNLVTRIPEERWAVNELEHIKRSEAGRSITFSAGVLSDVDKFDAEFFGISPREATWLDPQQRLLLELSWEAMENAGLPPSKLSGTNCAVYVGISSLDYGTRGLDDLASMSPHSMIGNTLSVAANRISYFFDLHGPSLAIDTACSSSLVALHHACQALQAGEAECALVGGVNLLLHPYPFIGFTKASMLSADGRCKAFDASGNGYVRAEGGAVFLLKPLERAIADGDDIHALILASGANADGARKTGITIPSKDGQAELMKNVLAKSGLSPQEIDYIEAHGTGTMVGDPIETSAIGAVYGQGRDKPLPIGSVKANLGHMEAASGMAGLVKAIMILKHRALPPQINLETLNPNIDFPALNIQPVTEYQELVKDDPLVVGVNSFGFGGANAHVLLQEFRSESLSDRLSPIPSSKKMPPLFLSARSDAALRSLADSYAVLLPDHESDGYDITYTAAYRRDRLEKRLAVMGETSTEVAQILSEFAKGRMPEGAFLEEALPQPGSVAFVYSGNGAQWVGMGQRLLEESSDFAELLSKLDQRMQPVAGFSVLTELQADRETSRLDDTVVAQPLLFAIQVALTQLLRKQGVEPAAVAGHSVGEVAAAWACGALDLDEAIRVIVVRSRAQGLTRGTGKMAAVGLSPAAMQEVLSGFGEDMDVAIAGINSPNNITLSGSLTDLECIQKHLAEKGAFFRLLDLDYAFHSRQMDLIRNVLFENLKDFQPASGNTITFVSSVTGQALSGSQLDCEYWWRNVREPVRFSDAITELAARGCRVFIEIGPHAILQRYIGECLAACEVKGRVLPTLHKENDGLQRIQETVLRAHLLADADLSPYFPHPGRSVQLPNYPWQRERHWHPRTSESLLAIERRRVHPLLGWRIPEAEYSWENILDPLVFPWLSDHKVGGAIVFPGSGYAEMALAAAKEWLGGETLVFEELDIVAPMVFDGEHARTLRFDLSERDGSFTIKSRQRLSNDEWTLHAIGRVLAPSFVGRKGKIQAPGANASMIDGKTHYKLAAALGLDYGPAFQGLRSATLDGDTLQAELELANNLGECGYLIHPAVLDVCYQSLVNFFQKEIESGQGVALLPVKIGQIEYVCAGAPTYFRAQVLRRSARSVLANFELYDAENRLLASISGCRFRAAALLHEAKDSVSRWHLLPCLKPHPTEGLTAALPIQQENIEKVSRHLDALADQRRPWFKEALPLFEALVVSFTFEAFRAISQLEDGRLDRLVVSSDPYLRWLAGLLRGEGLLKEMEGRWTLVEGGATPQAEEIWRVLEREYPACLPQLVLLGRVGCQLPHILSMRAVERREFLTRLLRTPVAETLYEDDPAYLGTRRAVEIILLQMAKKLPAHRRLRILEIAPGLSEVPRALLGELPEDRLDYVLALPEEFAERQQAEYVGHANLVIATLDMKIGQIVTDAGLPEAFDVVILRHVLHQTDNTKTFLKQAYNWLAAGGCLLMAERYPDWSADFLYGLDPSWWHEVKEGEMPASSLLSPSVWRKALEVGGFDQVMALMEPAADGLAEGAYLLIARRPEHGVGALPAPEASNWLLLTDSASFELAKELHARFESHGQRVVLAENLDKGQINGFDHIVDMRGWQSTPETVSDLLAKALDEVNTLVSESETIPRLWFITRGGALVSGLKTSDLPNPAQAALWGFGRVVMNEYPELNCTLVDISDDLSVSHKLNRLENELLHPDGSNEIVLTQTGRYIPVLSEANEKNTVTAREGEQFRLDFKLPGQLRNLQWFLQEERPLCDDEIEVRVQATGLNFRDVMYLMGLLSDEAVENGFAGASLGLEFAGVVSRVGSRVQDFQPGDRVMGFGSACFASHVITRGDAIAQIPATWSFESAATVPTAFFTAYYALKHLADLQAGERVLIHGGAGGVGIAAIQLAKHLGAEVFATAGSDEKRDFVRLLGADHVFDSRSLSFAEEILTVTRGEGVDVVLNSLAGEAIRRNLRVLKPFGRFLELGKRDFFENTPIGLRPFKDNISYFGIDADQLLTGRPRLAARLFREVMALFQEGVLTPLPCRVFPADRVVDAFRTMQQSKHIGKVVVSFDNAAPLLERADDTPTMRLDKASTWLITGGLSGFGLESARWLAEKGVGHLVLVGRRGIDTPGAREAIETLRAMGAEVEALTCDITDRQAVNSVIEHIRSACPPLKGILHAAAVFDDALLKNLNAERIKTVIDPKLIGAWNLHEATLGMSIEHFVLFSSITTAIGNPGQANYVAANGGLETLAEMRRHMGLPAVCIGWGPIGDAGYLTRNEVVKDSLEQRLGKPPITAQQALEQLERLMNEEKTVFVANFDWNVLSRVLPSSGGDRFSKLNVSLAEGETPESSADLMMLISGKSPEEAVVIVEQLVVKEVAEILAIAAERIDVGRPLHDLGLDSLMAVELALSLEQRFGIRLPVMMLSESPTAEKIARRIVDMLFNGTEEKNTTDALEEVVQDLAKQHGEMVVNEELQIIADEAERLKQQGGRLTE